MPLKPLTADDERPGHRASGLRTYRIGLLNSTWYDVEACQCLVVAQLRLSFALLEVSVRDMATKSLH